MSAPDHVTAVEERTGALLSPAGALPVEPDPSPVRATAWPSNRLASAVLWLLLAGALYLPVAMATPRWALAAAAALPTLACAAAARSLFDVLSWSPEGLRKSWRVAAASTAGLGVAAVAGSGRVLGIDASPLGAAIGIGGTFTILGAAGLVRALELRIGSSTRRIFFIGAPLQAADLSREVHHRGDLRLTGIASLDTEPPAGTGDGDLFDSIVASRATTLVMSAEAIRDKYLVAVASRLNLRGVHVRALNDFYGETFSKVPLTELSPSWFLFDVAEIHRARLYGAAKRVIETATATAALLLTAPLFPLIAVAVKLSSAGPLLITQERIGRHGERFRLRKVRTMVGPPEAGWWGTEHQHRVTGVGRLLRRFHLDEIPQLAHVVRGHMSLVGPRPEQPGIVDQLTSGMEFYSARHCVRPGITGWAQVNYGYGGTELDVMEKLQYDFFYIRNQSLRLDLRIVAATARTIATGRGL